LCAINHGAMPSPTTPSVGGPCSPNWPRGVRKTPGSVDRGERRHNLLLRQEAERAKGGAGGERVMERERKEKGKQAGDSTVDRQ